MLIIFLHVLYISKVFQLLHFLISIDEFCVFQVLLQYTFFYLVENMCRSPRECVTSQTPNTRPIWQRSLCIPIEDMAKAPLCLSLWRWDLFLHLLSPASPRSPQWSTPYPPTLRWTSWWLELQLGVREGAEKRRLVKMSHLFSESSVKRKRAKG